MLVSGLKGKPKLTAMKPEIRPSSSSFGNWSVRTSKSEVMKIYRRTKDGWSKRVPNKNKSSCDSCGQTLWVNPGGEPYCNGAGNENGVECKG